MIRQRHSDHGLKDYARKMKLILNDAERYRVIKRDPNLKIEKITQTLKHLWKVGTLMTVNVTSSLPDTQKLHRCTDYQKCIRMKYP